MCIDSKYYLIKQVSVLVEQYSFSDLLDAVADAAVVLSNKHSQRNKPNNAKKYDALAYELIRLKNTIDF